MLRPAHGLFWIILLSLSAAGGVTQAQSRGAAEAGSGTADSAERAEAAPETPYSLEKLIELAVHNDALVAEFQAKRAQAEWDKFRAEHITLMPILNATTLLSVVPDNANPDALDRNVDQILELNIGPFIRQDVELVLPLYTFGKSAAAQNLAELGLENNALEFENARLESIFQTRRAYWGLRLSLAFQEMLDEGAELIGDQLRSMQEKRDFGGVDFDIKDFRKLEIFDAELRSRIVDNQKLTTLARAGLHFLADIPDNVRIGVEPLGDLDEPPQLKPRDYYVERALAFRPELNQLDRAVKAREYQADLTRSKWWPDLFAAARFGFAWSTVHTGFQRICTASSINAAPTECEFPGSQATIDGQPIFAEPYGNPLHALSFQVGLGLRWNVEPFQLYGEMKKADAQADAVYAQRRRARAAVKLEVAKLFQEADDARVKIDINHDRLKAAERWRNQFGLSNQTAGADISEAVDPLQAYFDARVKYLQAIFDYRIARAELARAIGARDLGEDGSAVMARSGE